MPQTFKVLKCYKCEVFQVHPTKKAAKWECKVCGEKQSMKRFYGLGTGKECRLHVQRLNEIRSEIDSQHSNTNDLNNISENPDNPEQVQACTIANKSKWLDYVDSLSDEKQYTPEETIHLNETEVVLELPTKHKKKCLSVSSKTSVTDDNFQNESLHDNEKEPTRLLHEYKKDNDSSSMEGKNFDINTSTTISRLANKVTPRKYVPPPISHNSRWTQFVEDTQHCNDENESVVCSHSSVGSVFTLLDDEHIDSALDL